MRYTPYIWRYRRPLAVAAVLAVVETLLDLARPWPLVLAIDNAIGQRPLGQPWQGWLGVHSALGLATVSAAGVLAVAVTRALVGSLAARLTGTGAERLGADVRADVHRKLLRLSLRFHQRHGTGQLASRLTSDVGRVQDALAACVARALPEVLTLVGTVVALFLLDPVMAVAGLIVLPLLGLVLADRRRGLREAQRDHQEHQGLLAAAATEAMRNIRMVQALALEGTTQRDFHAWNRATSMSGLGAVTLRARCGPVTDVLLGAGTALVLWVGVSRVVSGRMTIGILVVVLFYLASMYGPVRSLARLGPLLGRGEASGHRLGQILASGEVLREGPHAPALPQPTREISLRSVSFAYAPGRPALHDVDLRIPVGGTVCVVGPTGAGKSTLLSLLLRLYDPDLGSVAVDGVDLRTFDLRSVRELMALVPQEPEIFDGTILQNIASGSRGASEAELLEAARLALLDDLALRLPRGLHSEVGEDGRLLSFGQRRCLAIARALVRKAPVMLMDEPTSGLDADSELRVITAIRRARWSRTLVIATHRLALAAQADHVAVLSGGRVVEQGTPADLLRADAHYARLWKLQLPGEAQRPRETLPVHVNGFAAAAAGGGAVHQ